MCECTGTRLAGTDRAAYDVRMSRSGTQAAGPRKRAHAQAVATTLAEAYPQARCALRYESPFQLLVATVLSAQTTDLAVNRATAGLFRDYPDATAMAAAPEDAIEAHIRSIGLWRNKARFIRGLSRQLVDRHGGEVPRDLKALTALPGVARKTATAVLGEAFGITAGITVDTHMLRICRLLGLSEARGADAMARELEALLPPETWVRFTHRIIDHGRIVCVARRPRCGVCPLAAHCPSARSGDAGYRPENDAREPASAAQASWRAISARGEDPA